MQFTSKPKGAFELKGAAFTIPVLHLLDADMNAVFAQLSKKVKQAADFFHNAPIVVNLYQLDDVAQVDLPELIRVLRGQGFIPVGLTGGTEQQKDMANAMELAILNSPRISKVKQQDVSPREQRIEPEKQEENPTDTSEKTSEPEREPEKEPEREPVVARMITSPVRSGQRIVASQGDLIVTAPVSSGAEIMAAGNIHVYGVLRGRALAGIKGDENARIFCQRFEADLVSVAGKYKVSEDFPEGLRSAPVQIRIQDSMLRVIAIQ
jgi:septum site-determining protein MinC